MVWLSRPVAVALVVASGMILTLSPCCLKKPLSSAICRVTVSALSTAPILMVDSSGAPLAPLLAVPPALDAELHAVTPTVSAAVANTSALWRIREAFIALLFLILCNRGETVSPDGPGLGHAASAGQQGSGSLVARTRRLT